MAKKWELEGVSVELGSNTLLCEGIVSLATYTVSALPSVVEGGIVYVSNGAAGNPCVAFGAGGKWCRCDTLAEVSAS